MCETSLGLRFDAGTGGETNTIYGGWWQFREVQPPALAGTTRAGTKFDTYISKYSIGFGAKPRTKKTMQNSNSGLINHAARRFSLPPILRFSFTPPAIPAIKSGAAPDMEPDSENYRGEKIFLRLVHIQQISRA